MAEMCQAKESNRELLELAAKAAGLKRAEYWCSGHNPPFPFAECMTHFTDDDSTACKKRWNPLTDDGEALRLAVMLNMRIVVSCDVGITDVAAGDGRWISGGEHHWSGPDVATRRGIVRAAAEVGRQLK